MIGHDRGFGMLEVRTESEQARMSLFSMSSPVEPSDCLLWSVLMLCAPRSTLGPEEAVVCRGETRNWS